jgi:hypothetical protein
MNRKILCYLLSAATVYLSMSYFINAFFAIIASFGLAVI